MNVKVQLGANDQTPEEKLPEQKPPKVQGGFCNNLGYSTSPKKINISPWKMNFPFFENGAFSDENIFISYLVFGKRRFQLPVKQWTTCTNNNQAHLFKPSNDALVTYKKYISEENHRVWWKGVVL